jgi:hypothetical protein
VAGDPLEVRRVDRPLAAPDTLVVGRDLAAGVEGAQPTGRDLDPHTGPDLLDAAPREL